MKNWKDQLQNLMRGRYGVDDLGRFLLYLSGAMVVLSFFIRTTSFFVLTALLVAYSWFRMLSRNTAARWSENQRFTGFWKRMTASFRLAGRAARDRDHVYLVCPGCGQKIRVPRGKGMIEITCPRCRTRFQKRT